MLLRGNQTQKKGSVGSLQISVRDILIQARSLLRVFMNNKLFKVCVFHHSGLKLRDNRNTIRYYPTLETELYRPLTDYISSLLSFHLYISAKHDAVNAMFILKAQTSVVFPGGDRPESGLSLIITTVMCQRGIITARVTRSTY